jgi:protoporphyrinogen oxidase
LKKIVVIGAGPAGLTFAHEILKKSGDFHVTILEAEQTVGGISKTIKSGGNRMDIGGHRFFSKDEEVVKLWTELLPLQGSPAMDDILLGKDREFSANGPDPEREDEVMLIRDRVSRIYYGGKFFDYPVSPKWQTFKNIGFFKTIQAGFSYLRSLIFKRKENSLEDFYINRFGKTLYSMFFEGYTEKLWGRHPSQISADWGAQRVKGLSILAVLRDMLAKIFRTKRSSFKVETSLIKRFMYPKFGPGQLWEAAARRVVSLGGEIMLSCNVEKIHQSNGKITGVTYRAGGESVFMECDILVSSMPVKDLIGGLEYAPESVAEIAAALPYRDFITVGLECTLALKNETKIKTLGNIVPDCWIYVQDTGVKLGRIQIFNNWSPYMAEKPTEKTWIGLEYFCDENDRYWNMPDDDFARFAVGELCSMGIISSPSQAGVHHVEHIKKAYPAYFGSYAEFETVRRYLDSFGNLFCLGRNGQHRYNNMDHSMLTAFEAVKNILSGTEGKDNIWNVNTEKSYHEEDNQEKSI